MRKYILYLILILLVGGGIFFLTGTTLESPISSEAERITAPVPVKHASHIYDPNFFSQSYDKGQQYQKKVREQILGGIIPHHLLAAPLIAGFFAGISDQDIETIILLSPNHYGVGSSNISTSKGVWTTIFGDLETAVTKISQLENDHIALVNEDLFDTEHGIYGLTPFIKKTFPNAKMIPLAINNGTPKTECDRLVQVLSKIMDGNTLVIVSADFSHYLPSNQSDEYDKESITAIESFAVDRVFSLDSEKNLDSPESVYILLQLMQLKKATKSIRLANTNSAKLTDKWDLQSTTSYLTMYFAYSDSNKN